MIVPLQLVKDKTFSISAFAVLTRADGFVICCKYLSGASILLGGVVINLHKILVQRIASENDKVISSFGCKDVVSIVDIHYWVVIPTRCNYFY